MNVHPAADIFPPMANAEFGALKADIAANGVREPVRVWQRQIIDGRHRARACEELGIDCPTLEWCGDEASIVPLVISLNLKRRHLSPSQLAFVALAIERVEGALAKERMLATQNNRAAVEITPQQPDAGKSRDKAAAAVGVNARYVSDAKRIQHETPLLARAVQSGDMTLTQAMRELKERHREHRRAENRERIESAPTAEILRGSRFATIVLDPPWDWGDEGDGDQFGRARPTYGTMSFEEVRSLPVAEFADIDCHLYLWITNRSLPKGFALLEAWGFRYITTLTWCKPSIGMGNYFRGATEHVLFGVRGSQPLLRKDVGTWFAAPRGRAHSAKPSEFFSLIETCSPAPRLEMFARSRRHGWTAWGADADAA